MRNFLLAFLLLVTSGAAMPAEFDGDVDAYLGYRGMEDHDFWAYTIDQGAFGIQANFGVDEFPINGEIGFNFSGENSDFGHGWRVTDSFSDFGIGALYRPLKSRMVQPYLGVGLASISVRERQENNPTLFGCNDCEDHDTSGAIYAHTGVKVLIVHHINVGLDARVLRGSRIQLFGQDGDANYSQVTLRAGFSWGAPHPYEAPRAREERPAKPRVVKPRSPRATRRPTTPPDGEDAVGF